MTEKTDANSLGAALRDRDDALQEYRGVSRSNGVAFYVPNLRHGRSGQAPSARGQFRQGAVRPQKRAPNYPVVLACSDFLLFIGLGIFALAMAIQNEAIAEQHTPRPKPIYYCATGAEMPAFEPCTEMKSLRDI